MKQLAQIAGTFFYVGYMRPFSGTWGSAAALPVAYGLYLLGGPYLVAIGAVLAFFVGWWATAVMIEGQDDHDPSEVVLDEVAGQWIALLPVLIGATHAGVDPLVMWPGWLVAFFGFRFFDILKPGPIGTADARGDALGVMLDDILAGIAAAITVGILAYVYHGLIA
ncbi:phosphatidylglycerophosphatase A [Lentibacter algarum]|uniref:phosphatidylglycerophosphatase A family protein n=1 Tax=Lentibacter algarum TaxID=576131 RepID=UPI001C07608A|nr:phosphatidylglycerophosphatase A [Lentibacter algarum]MBU2982298.1 phosphatidylglycerophosphatase A [Lentibacter algarum]